MIQISIILHEHVWYSKEGKRLKHSHNHESGLLWWVWFEVGILLGIVFSWSCISIYFIYVNDVIIIFLIYFIPI